MADGNSHLFLHFQGIIQSVLIKTGFKFPAVQVAIQGAFKNCGGYIKNGPATWLAPPLLDVRMTLGYTEDEMVV